MIFNKGGLSHIEVIISFVIFLGFISFAFYFFSPFESGRTLKASLAYSFDEIVENVSVSLESYSVSLNNCGDTTISIENPSPISGNVKIIDINGDILGGIRDGNNFCIGTPQDFVTILISEVFPDSSGTCVDITNPCSNISSSENMKILSERKIEELKENYELDYETIKENFNLPGRIDFGFSIIFNDAQKIVAEKEIPENLEVDAKKKRIEIIRENGDIEFADLIVEVW